jgi:hypothetical protein
MLQVVQLSPNRSDGEPPVATAEQAVQSTYDALDAQALITVEALIDARAKTFAQFPSQLESIERGLSKLSPRKMRARLVALIDAEFSAPRRHFGLGGCIPLMNLNAGERYAARLVAIQERESQ